MLAIETSHKVKDPCFSYFKLVQTMKEDRESGRLRCLKTIIVLVNMQKELGVN